MDRFSVYGWWQDSDERFGQTFVATNARHAEELMQDQARNEGGVFRAAGTLLGEHPTADTYTGFVDPDDARNVDREDLEPAFEELEMTEYTVLGLALSTRLLDHGWNRRTGGERWLGREMATSPRYAEDNARLRIAEAGHFELRVCAVFVGVKNRCESLPFSNPDERAG